MVELERALTALNIKLQYSNDRETIHATSKTGDTDQPSIKFTISVMVQQFGEDKLSFISFVKKAGDPIIYRSICDKIQKEIAFD